MKNLSLFVQSSLVVFCSISCKDAGTQPPGTPKDPRTYTWTVDTLSYPGNFQTLMTSIWGSSSSDVYVVGSSDGGSGKMYHFNGTQWKPLSLSFGPIDLEGVYGFGPNNVFAVGENIYVNNNRPPNFFDSSLVIQFDGTKWQRINHERRRRLISVWGSSPSDI